jgi:hypothetical protein
MQLSAYYLMQVADDSSTHEDLADIMVVLLISYKRLALALFGAAGSSFLL